jgi:hypothetical protein
MASSRDITCLCVHGGGDWDSIIKALSVPSEQLRTDAPEDDGRL